MPDRAPGPATLVFEHDGWTVTTSSWAAASKKGCGVSLCYPWSSSGGLGFFAQATGVAHKEFETLSMEDFINRVAAGGVVDLRQA